MSKPIITTSPESYAPALNVLRERITVLASEAATDGYEVFLHRGDESVGPPPHSHAWDESFFVIRGEVHFQIGERTLVARAGSFVHVPKGTVHAFRYGAGGAELLGVTGASSNASKLFTSIDEEIAADAPEIPKVVAVLERHGATLAH
jgi:quercetin dioxygenase-like cupin family protein